MAPRERVYVVVDNATIARGNTGEIIAPIWWSANIYDGPGMYELSLRHFSKAQRLVFAVLWYIAEVNNGGHHQFYSNSTGIVWRDAIAGFDGIGIPEASRILTVSAERLGGSPSLERDERNEQLDSLNPDFDDLDEAFYDIEKKVDIDEHVTNFIRSRPSDFYFSGEIERVVLPGR
jgi:hypothetical protein